MFSELSAATRLVRSARSNVRPVHAAVWLSTGMQRLIRQIIRRGDDRGDVPGWVLVTLMTAGLVVALWGASGPRLIQVFNDGVDSVVGGP